jgi:subtilase family serine protease
MSKVFSRKKIISILSPVLLGMLSMQAEAKPTVPPGWKAKPPIIVVSKHGLMQPQGGITPAQISVFYGFPASQQGKGETIAIVDAYDDPNIEADLGVFSTQFNLPACTTANGCFKKVYASGTQPEENNDWAGEISLDVEWAHAVAPLAKIILVESTDDNESIFDAVTFAETLKPSVISLSWGGEEWAAETSLDSIFSASTVPIVAASGDSGAGVIYPAASPYVVSAGGTQATMGNYGNYVSEIAWSGSGGGVSAYEKEPAFQTTYGVPQATGMRAVPDVAYNASPFVPYNIYDSLSEGWILVGGTSAAAPQWAGLIADMKAAKNGNFGNFNGSIYSVAKTPSLLHDITSGTNGTCGYYCTARSGYDYVTGLGSPQATNLITRFQ